MNYIIKDSISGLFWNRKSYRHHGMWLTHTAYSPKFETEVAALEHAKAVGMNLDRVCVIEFNVGVGGFDGWA